MTQEIATGFVIVANVFNSQLACTYCRVIMFNKYSNKHL